MLELAQKKRWMFARGTLQPPLILFEEKVSADKAAWRSATPVLGAINGCIPVDFPVTAQYSAGFHVSSEIPAVDIGESQRLVFLKFYGPNFGLRYVGAMYVNCLQDVTKGYKGISATMQARFNMPLPDNVDYYRLLGADNVQLIDMSSPPALEEGKVAASLPVPEHGEIIVMQSSSIEAECLLFQKIFYIPPIFSA